MRDLRKDIVLDSFERVPRNMDEEFERLYRLTVSELTDELDKCWNRETDYCDWERAIIIRRVICNRLGIPLLSDMNEDLRQLLQEIVDVGRDLQNRFENHRHKKEPSYSAKPNW